MLPTHLSLDPLLAPCVPARLPACLARGANCIRRNIRASKGSLVVGNTDVRIQKRLLSLQQFSNAKQTTSQVFKTVSPFSQLEIFPIHRLNHKNILQNTSIFNWTPRKAVMVMGLSGVADEGNFVAMAGRGAAAGHFVIDG
ncbi:hypothetical protein E2C01_080403 [Portunus trituberculatus]|uniref:Uncharacterized protein n=1 Tax=Portunus trituberculatus TaxID=210409 RepID=A0A5B7IP80_PORTR|nr:hypothetical protein [Portunus trituberculatus]